MLECRGFVCPEGYCMLVMDPDTSGMTWDDVAAAINCGGDMPSMVYSTKWAVEENPGDPEAHAAYIAQCKAETLRLAEAAFTPATQTEVTLSL